MAFMGSNSADLDDMLHFCGISFRSALFANVPFSLFSIKYVKLHQEENGTGNAKQRHDTHITKYIRCEENVTQIEDPYKHSSHQNIRFSRV